MKPDRRASPVEAARHLGDLASFAVRRRSIERADAQALAELERRTVQLPAGLEVEWLGVAGFRLTYEGSSLIVDPYLSRIPLRRFLRREPALPDPALVERVLGDAGEVVGVVAGHTHFDHAIDVPAVAERLGCPAFGSRSLVRLMAAHGLEDRAALVEAGERRELGPFAVTFVPSRHSRIVLGRRVPMDGDIDVRSAAGLSARAYRCGQVWALLIEVAGARLYHQGSADLVDDEVPGGGVDLFLAGIAGREFTPDYWGRILPRLDPAQVVISHHDDFFAGLGEPFGFVPNVRVAAVPDEVAGVARDVVVAALPRIVPT
ncbi:MAG TPA: MBL fold metallo-hydrolase [Actinomycetota bacterium]|nr:MBL fold metallo-hydrolase [Actinomycetota bacterium]